MAVAVTELERRLEAAAVALGEWWRSLLRRAAGGAGHPGYVRDLEAERDALAAEVERLGLEADEERMRAGMLEATGRRLADMLAAADTRLHDARARVAHLEGRLPPEDPTPLFTELAPAGLAFLSGRGEGR